MSPAEDPASGQGSGVHPLVGFASVDESARIVRNYRYAVERMMRILGGWIALTPELSAKLLFGRHVWDNAQHADALGKRLPELRAAAQVSEPANARFVAFMSAVEEPEGPEQTVERLVGVYRVLKPHLLASYEDHLRRLNAVYEPPTERILARLAEDERRHIGAGLIVLRHLTSSAALGDRAQAWQDKLEGLLGAADGVIGTGMPAPISLDGPRSEPLLNDDARQFVRLERSLTHWPMPGALEEALRAFGEAVVARDPARVERWLTPGDRMAGRLAELGARSHRVVAFAKIGQKRVVKIRLEGPGDALTLVTRWAPTADGWRAEAVDAIGADVARPT